MSECHYCVHGDIDVHDIIHCALKTDIVFIDDDGVCEMFEFDTGEEDE